MQLQGLPSSEAIATEAGKAVIRVTKENDQAARLRSSLAQTLLRSPNYRGTATFFAQHQIPTRFYRQEESF